MAINFCVNCGERLGEGAHVCAACGEAVPDSIAETDHPSSKNNAPAEETGADAQHPEEYAQQADDEEFLKYADLSGFDVINTYPVYAPEPDPRPPAARMSEVLRSNPEQDAQKEAADRAASPKRTRMALATVATVAVASLAVGAIMYLNGPSNLPDNNIVRGAADIADQAVAAEASSLGAVRDAAASFDVEGATEQLQTTYDKLQDYNNRVFECTEEYNSAFLVSERSVRETTARRATDLLEEMGREQEKLDMLGIGHASPLYNDYANVSRLLNDQYLRLASIVESWEISLKYDNPYQYQDEILAPLRRDTGAQGQNVYQEDFDENYWSYSPQL